MVVRDLNADAVPDQIRPAVANVPDDSPRSIDASAYQGCAHIAESRIARREIADGAIGLLDGVQQSALERQLRSLRRFALCVEGFDEITHCCITGHFSAQGAAHAIADYVEMRVSVIAKTILVIRPLAAGVGCRRERQGECGWSVHESEIEWRSQVNRKLFLLHGKSPDPAAVPKGFQP